MPATNTAAAAALPDVLSFTVGGQRLALAAGVVADIIRPRPITRVPHAPASMIGVANLRGTVLPVLSTAALLGQSPDQAPAAPAPAARVVIVRRSSGADRLGLLVDSVAALRPANGERLLDLDALLARDFSALAQDRAQRRESASAPAALPAPSSPATGRDDVALIGFALSGQEYGLKLTDIDEVGALPPSIAALPRTDAAMIGAAPWRGAVLPMVSLRVLLGLHEAADRPAATRVNDRLIVARVGGRRVGLVVDAMRAILRVPRADIDTVPPVLTRGMRGEARIEAIARLDGGRRLMSILSPVQLFDDETMARLSTLHRAVEAEEAGTTPDSPVGEHSIMQQFVVFQLGDEHYGLPIAAVDEVVRRPRSITRVPSGPEFLEGVMNLRGRAVPVINQRLRFALPAGGEDAGNKSRVVILTIDGLQAGFVVDAVSEVLSVSEAALQVTPMLETARDPLFDRVATIERDGRMILLIDAKALLDRAERDMLARTSAEAGAATVP
jgi:purine-binding chemotaxis protein CheW